MVKKIYSTRSTNIYKKFCLGHFKVNALNSQDKKIRTFCNKIVYWLQNAVHIAGISSPIHSSLFRLITLQIQIQSSRNKMLEWKFWNIILCQLLFKSANNSSKCKTNSFKDVNLFNTHLMWAWDSCKINNFISNINLWQSD